MKQIFGLMDLIKEPVRYLYDAEVGKMLSGLNSIATSPNLAHQTKAVSAPPQENVVLLAHRCYLLGAPPTGVTCQQMDGLLREAKDPTHNWGDPVTIGAALIANAQRIVHYEITECGTGRGADSCLGGEEVAQLWATILNQANENEKAFTRLAIGRCFTSGINPEAAKSAA